MTNQIVLGSNIVAPNHNIIIYVSQLIIEVTRKCNFNCAHCLRGPSENLDINFSFLQKIAQTISPYGVTFTGGEPSLNLDAIQSYMNFAEDENTLPSNFFIATNGSVNQLDLAILALRMYSKMEEKDACYISISRDQYHDEFLDEEVAKDADILKGLAFYSDMKEHVGKHYYDNNWLINMGNAAINGIGNSKNKTETGNDLLYVESYINEDGNIVYDIDQLFVSAKGFITASCDLSYEEADKNHLCTIDTLQEYLMANYAPDKDDYEDVED